MVPGKDAAGDLLKKVRKKITDLRRAISYKPT